jgi:predicted short-subunit dehydrogenase-like oxidoreductase (DUF2520 family)
MARAVTIVGPGRMGLALGAALVQSEAVERLTVFGRRPEPPAHPLFTQGRARYVFGVEPLERDTTAVFLAVPDAAVPEMAFTLGAQGPSPEGCVAYHLSGSLPTDVLAPLHQAGYELGAFHPLQAVSNPVSAADRIPGSFIAVTGSPLATAVARDLARGLGCEMFTVPANRRPLHHAATVLASNYLLPLLDLSARLMERAGAPPEDALRALLPLVRGTLSSIEERGLKASGRGPLVRGDAETVALHLRALDPEDQRLYALFGSELLRLVETELDDHSHAALAELFDRHVALETSGKGS